MPPGPKTNDSSEPGSLARAGESCARALGVALEVQARRLRSIELSGSLRVALVETLHRLSTSIKLYMTLYMVVIAGFLATLVGLVVWRFPGQPLMVAGAVLGAIGLAVWSYTCGRAYLQQQLGGFQPPLEAALRDLGGVEA